MNKIDFDWDPRRIFTRVYKPTEARPNDQPEGPNRNDRKWMQWYEELAEFKKQYGHCIVTRSANNSLGIWVQKQRKLYRDRQKGKASKILTEERIVSEAFTHACHTALLDIELCTPLLMQPIPPPQPPGAPE